jgi:hypothetical protein
MKTRLLLIVLFSSLFGVINAQSLEPKVIAASGAFIYSAGYSMTWTIGEVMTDTYSSSGNFFTQGFNQPDTESVTALVNLFPDENIRVYPNPAISYITIDLKDAPGDHVLYMYTMLGQILLRENIPTSQQQLEIPLTEFANGLYLINIINHKLNLSSSFKINKVQ